MRRIAQLGTWLLVLTVCLAPLFELFDRWDAPGLGNDTEMIAFCLVLLLCLLLAVCRLLARLAQQSRETDIRLRQLPERPCRPTLQGFRAQPILPPLSPPLRI